MPSPKATIPLLLSGRGAAPELPSLLVPATRAAVHGDDPFLPPGYLEPVAVFDTGPAAREIGSAAANGQPTAHDAAPDDLLVLESADGTSLVTSAARLQSALAQTHPEWIGPDGAIRLEALRADSAMQNLADAGNTPRGVGSWPGTPGAPGVLGGIIARVIACRVGASTTDPILDDARAALQDPAELGVSWLGTQALMAAIEARLDRPPGLYRWDGASGRPADLMPVDLNAADAAPPLPNRPMLVFVHGIGSNTLGAFCDLRSGDRDLWAQLAAKFTGGIFAFEHRTFSVSPIENATLLASALPRGATLTLVTHSSGGLVGDLLCLGEFDALIDGYAYAFPGTGHPDPAESARVRAELDLAHAAQRTQLRTLAGVLRERRLTVTRYLRVASPAHGTLLASGNLDFFLSSLLGLIGLLPFFFGSPWYSAFKRIVVEIARHRTDPHLVPGVEAMLPDSPMARLLRDAPIRPGTAMAVVAGDIQGGTLLRRLGIVLTDFLLFENEDNDLVVNTTSMLAGIAPRADARVLFDRGADVSHFRYFSNGDTRAALRDWLTVADPSTLEAFRSIPSADSFAAALAAAAPHRDVAASDRPVVVLLPGIMGSHLIVGGGERVWFDPVDLAAGGLAKIAWGTPSVEADTLFAMFYGKLCARLAESHRVETFAYDWRQPLDVLAERFGEFLDRLLKSTAQPIRLLAHSMGGLVVRAAIVKRRPVLDALMARDGARLVMLGTPHQGAHSMVGNLLGKGDTLRTLVRLDLRHDMQQVLDIVAGFRGALTLLPKPGFVDLFEGQDGGGEPHAWQDAATWVGLKAEVTDFWFGDGRAGTPSQETLDQASWLWRADGSAAPALPAGWEAKSIYVFGVAPNTPCGIRRQPDAFGTPRLKLVGTTHGDGTVTWQSGRIGGIGRFYYLPAAHGDLLSTEEHFPAIVELLAAGMTARLATAPPAMRGDFRALEAPLPVTYDAGPPTADDPDALQRGLMGGSARNRVPPRPKRRLEVAVKAMDLRFIATPILVGHYERDAIAGAEALIDRELLGGDLSQRNNLGLYAGERGSATIVLRVPNDLERQRGSLSGAVVTGLGSYDRPLSPTDLTEAIRAGVLRYLLQVIDVLGKAPRELPLSTLLVGYNSSANLTVAASVESLVRGVMEANTKFFETTRLDIRIARLEIVELYLNTAISAVYALRDLARVLAAQARTHGTLLVCRDALVQGEGVRQRLSDDRSGSYWPRMIIVDADRPEDTGMRPAPGAASDAAPIAERLRFTYVGQRARAESVALQRQPGLVEQLVAQQIGNPVWSEDFGRMLFQLMVPHDFKDAARQLDRVVLVVDAYAANLPWELMLADDPDRSGDEQLPLALRTAVVRQLATSVWRPQVHQSVERRALVIGNPSVAGFTTAFPLIGGQPTATPPALPGAEAEALSTARVLAATGYSVESVIGTGQPASAVLTRLFGKPWRLLHISAHGVFGLPHADGRRRSGVLLSDGLLITAAEIAAMENVPELVFLNCCHLGKIGPAGDDGGTEGPTDNLGGQGNLLAASIARELIDVGVRCVVVAGWAVGDESARLFAETFYEALLLRRRAFGDAVFEARRAAWQAWPTDITWGAFQAYGEPGWLAEPRLPGVASAMSDGMAASPEELLDDLARSRADLARLRENLSAAELKTQVGRIATLLDRRCPPAWRTLPQLQSALGRTWFELGQLEQARDCLLAAVQSVDRIGLVPIHDIEKLASVESRLGDQRAQHEIAHTRAERGIAGARAERGIAGARAAPAVPHTAEGLIDMALRRLDGLDALVATHIPTAPDAMPGTALPHAERAALPHPERAALRGGAWKRKASLQARRLLAGHLGEHTKDVAVRTMTGCLEKAIAAYQGAEGDPGSSDFSPVHALNRLALDALTDWPSPSARSAAIELAQQCRRAAAQGFAASASVWEAVWQAEALLVERLIDGSLGREGEAGRAVFEEVARAYADAMANVTTKPSQVETIAAQMELLSRLCDAYSLAEFADAALARTASRLLELGSRVQPGRPPRVDRPPSTPPAPPAASGPSTSPPPPSAARPAARRKRAAAQTERS